MMGLREESFHTQESVKTSSGAQFSREVAYIERSRGIFISCRTLLLCCCTTRSNETGLVKMGTFRELRRNRETTYLSNNVHSLKKKKKKTIPFSLIM